MGEHEGQDTPRWLRVLGRIRRPPPRWRGALLVVAAVVFVAGAVLAAQRLELELSSVRWWWVAVVAVLLVPATIAANVAELAVLGRTVEVEVPPREGLEVVLVATAANFLPVPGAAAVRVHALVERGAGVGAATAVNVLGGVAWVGVALVVAGMAGLGPAPLAGLLLLAGGIVAGGVAAVLLTRWRGVPPQVAAMLVSVEIAIVATHALRLGVLLVAIGRAASPSQVLVLGANGPLAAAAGIFPSGLGLAEALGAALAALVSLAPAAGFAVTAANRLIGVAVTAPVAAALGVGRLRGSAPPDE